MRKLSFVIIVVLAFVCAAWQGTLDIRIDLNSSSSGDECAIKSDIRSQSGDYSSITGVSSLAMHNSPGTVEAVRGCLGNATASEMAGRFSILKGVWGHASTQTSGGSVYGVQGSADVWKGDVNILRGGRFRIQAIEDTSVVVAEGMYANFYIAGKATYVHGLRVAGYLGGNVESAYGASIGRPTVNRKPKNWYGLRIGNSRDVGKRDSYSIYSDGGDVHLGMPTKDMEILDAGFSGATEYAWVKVKIGSRVGYFRVYDDK